jgi:hypothetical protein
MLTASLCLANCNFASRRAGHNVTSSRWSGRTMARIGLRMMPPFPWSPLSSVRRGFPSTAGRLAFQVVPFLMSLRLSQHQACAVQHVGLRLPFVHSVASSCAPLCVGTMDSVMHRHSRSWLLYPRGPRSGLGYIVPVHLRLFDLIRPTRRHIPISPHGDLYGMPSLCWCT